MMSHFLTTLAASMRRARGIAAARPVVWAGLAVMACGALAPLSGQATAVRVQPDGGGPGSSGPSTASPPPAPTTRQYGPPRSVHDGDARRSVAVPPSYAPPAGMCRVWVSGVPPTQQPAPTQ